MAVLKLSQISASGSNFTSGDFIVAVQGGTTDVLFTPAQVFAFANLVYASNVLAQLNSTTAQTFQVYNTFTDSSNYERGVFDWTTTTNVLTIGTEKLGTGTGREIWFQTNSSFRFNTGGAGLGLATLNDTANGLVVIVGGILGISGGNLRDSPTPQAGITSPAAGVIAISSAYNVGSNGFLQWGGQKRVTSNFSTGNSTTLADITGLSVTVVAGRTYSFEAVVPTTSDVAAGVKFAIAGTATATDIWYEAIVDSGGSVVVQTRSAALGTTVGAITTVTAAYCRITGTITVNAGGTLTAQMAQNVGNATGSVALRGSYFIVQDMP